MPVAVARFRERYPDIELTIEMADPDESLPGLRSGQHDLALSHDAMSELGDAGSGVEVVRVVR